MNNTKWEEIRRGMLEMARPPAWRTRHAATGFVSAWDREWYYHLSDIPFEEIEWLEIAVASPSERTEVLAVLRRAHVPGCETVEGFRVLGYAEPGATLSYLGSSVV